jgi:hypothetical protein
VNQLIAAGVSGAAGFRLRFFVVSVVIGLCVTALFSGCASAKSFQRSLPVGVSVSVFQNRSDFAPRHLEVEVDNRSKSRLSLSKGSFISAYFTRSAAIHSLPYELAPGDDIAFPVYLTESVCDSPAPRPRVSLAFADPAGAGQATVTPRVLYSALEQIHAHDCALASFEKVVTITPGDSVAWSRDGSGQLVSSLGITLTPTGQPGTVTLLSIDNTTLLDLTLDTRLPLSMSAGSAPQTVLLMGTPTRCETHVLSEDKVGTVLPLHVRTAEYPDGFIEFVLNDTLRFEYYRYFALACGFSG